MNYKNIRIGERNLNSYGTEMVIIDYLNSVNVTVEFQDEYKYKTNTTYHSFKSGKVRNPFDRTVMEIGFLGIGDYSAKNNHRAYQVWVDMLKRCYNPHNINIASCYDDCFVCEEWEDFQKFAEWYEYNYYEVNSETMHLDKDILFKGNVIYSPNTCIFVPQKINDIFVVQQKIKNNGLPIGCYIADGRLCVSCRVGDKRVNKSGFKQVDDAFSFYKTTKENYIKQVAEEYREYIPEKLYQTLINYEIDMYK